MKNPTPRSQRSTDQGARSTLAWSLGGALLATLCCVGPLVAVLLGLGGATGALGLVRYKLEFVALGLLVTLIGIGLSLRRSKACCSVKTYRRNRVLIPAVSLTVFTVLVIGANAALLNNGVLGAVTTQLTAERQPQQNAITETVAPETSASAAQQVEQPGARQLDVAITDGVWCAGCLAAIGDELLGTPGIQDIMFVKEASSPGRFVLRVFYQSDQVDAATVLSTITYAPGSVGGQYGAEIVADEPAP